MQLKSTVTQILSQLIDVCKQLKNDDYAKPLPILMNNSIGKHIRHIIEFFDLLLESDEKHILNYDNRNRNEIFETDKNTTIEKLLSLKKEINNLNPNTKIKFEVCYEIDGNESVTMPSNIAREIVYNIEHAIHHMAIIKIAIKQVYPHIRISKSFGVAYSTLKYLKECVQ